MNSILQLLAPAAGAAVLNGLLLLLGLVARAGRLRRNHLVGIRTRTTLTSVDAWTAAHRAASGPWILGSVVGLVCVCLAIAAQGGLPSVVLLGAGVVVVFTALVVGSVVGTVAARRARSSAG